MNLYEKIITIYPSIAIDINNIDTTNPFINKQIILQNDNDGNGEYIAHWEHPTLAKPTQEQLDGIN